MASWTFTAGNDFTTNPANVFDGATTIPYFGGTLAWQEEHQQTNSSASNLPVDIGMEFPIGAIITTYQLWPVDLASTVTMPKDWIFQGSADNSPEAGRCITHLEQVITPSASSSKILATVTIVGNASNDAFPNLSFKTSAQVGLGFGTIHNGTHVHATSPSGQTPTMGGDYENGSTNNKIRNSTYSFLHSPNTTNAVYYMPTVSIWSGQYFFYNRGETHGGDGWYGAGMSTITLMEIGA